VFSTIAAQLARSGFAVLAYDDRATGASGGLFATATTLALADDAEAAWRWTQAHKLIDSKRVGIAGHSEGGIVAMVVASRVPEVAFIVSIAGPAVAGEHILTEQLKLILKAQGVKPDVLAQESALQAKMIACMKTNTGWEVIREELVSTYRSGLEKTPKETQERIGDLDAFALKQANDQIEASKSKWLREFITLEPSTYLAKIQVPVLAIFGSKDLQVPGYQSEPALRGALPKETPVLVATIAGANHLFQQAITGAPSEYAVLKKEFHPEFLKTLKEWLATR
jgi:pimeloyl-ACP methyl ester carboxylesterase